MGNSPISVPSPCHGIPVRDVTPRNPPQPHWKSLSKKLCIVCGFFQNIVNAAQIWLKGRRDDRIIQRLHGFHEKKHARMQAAQRLIPQEEHAELLSELPVRVKDRLKK